MVRALRPDQLVVLPSGLWVLDAQQPVAAVLDSVTGTVLRLVSWRESPPADGHERWPGPQVLSDGSCLWSQQQALGPLVRVGLRGVETTAWTGGLLLAACGPSAAWCAPAPPDQELVAGPDPHPVRQLGRDRLLRVDADGSSRTVRIERPVRRVQAAAHGLLVQVDVEGWTLRHLGADLHEVLRASRWLRLPWDAEPPEELSVAEHGLAADFVPGDRIDSGGRGPFFWHEGAAGPDDRDDGEEPFGSDVEFGLVEDDDGTDRSGAAELADVDLPELDLDLHPSPLVVLGLVWRFGWVRGLAGASRRAVASADDTRGQEVRRWDLGVGAVRSVAPIGQRLYIALGRDGDAGTASPSAGRVLVLDPTSDAEAVELLADGSVDIAEHCWPLAPQRIDVDSYLAQTLADNSALESYWRDEPDAAGETQVRPLAAGMSAVRTTLVGDWPYTHLQWTFSYAPYPGLVLRRQVPLLDEVGRPDPPQYADIHLMEDLDTRNLPPATEARHGVLDI